ncbi:ATP-binding protein [Actinospongicola halichondriae]|uniref:PAS domain-containing hybrid sensor histidine kinase/response regulator n=1 Tax=Actinospongicola halichondriae TaxID=3236844 RepID=UPI003D404EDB
MATRQSRTTLHVVGGNTAARRAGLLGAQDDGLILEIAGSRPLYPSGGRPGDPADAQIVTVRSDGRDPATYLVVDGVDGHVVLVDAAVLDGVAGEREAGHPDWDDLGFWAIDLVTSERYVSTQVFRMLGDDELGWRDLIERVHDDDRVMVEHVAERARSVVGPYRLEHRFLVDGRWHHFRHRLQSIAGPDGRPARLIGVTSELSGASDRDVAVDLSEGDRRVSLLARGMIHDFKNSLAVIAGHADLAQQSAEAGEAVPPEHLAVIGRVASEAAEITTRLLHAGRPGLGVTRYIDVRAVMGRITPLAQATLGRTAEVSVTIEPTTRRIIADPDRLDGALIDVLINARDAMSTADRRLHLHYEERDLVPDTGVAADHDLVGGRYGFLSMTDNGAGMDVATLAHAREPLYTTKDADKGSGLGLSMAAEFARSCGGALLLESVPGEGTTVTFVVPTVSRHRRRAALRARRLSVVLVGDDTERCEEIRQHLDRGFQTVFARSDRELDHLLRTEPVDAVLEVRRSDRPAIQVWLGAPWEFSAPASTWSASAVGGLGDHISEIIAERDRPSV